MTDPIVVVGASLAGLRAARALRTQGWDGPLTVVGAEAHRPYDRPPLSKRALTDPGADLTRLTSLDAGDLDVEWHLSTAATEVDIDRRRLRVARTGARAGISAPYELAFSGLVVATGAHPRSLPLGEGRGGVHLLRTLDDAAALRADLAGAPKVAVIGAGFIGLEVASSCRQLGLEVTVVEAAPVPLARALGPVVGAAMAERHRRAGTTVLTGTSVTALPGGPRVEAVEIGGGRRIPADVVVIGVGATPTTGWLESSRVDLHDGVLCDDRLRVRRRSVALPHVVAAGDVARWSHPVTGRAVRAEHWTAATESADAAAAALLRGDEAVPYAPLPYVWSDQLGTKLQMVGDIDPDDDVEVVDGELDGDRWVAEYRRGGRLVAAAGSGRPARVMRLRAAIVGAAHPGTP